MKEKNTIKSDVDKLLSQVNISDQMYQNIMAGSDGAAHRDARRGEKMNGFSIKNAIIPAAAVILAMNVMYVGAGYVMQNKPLRELFMTQDADALTVPQGQQNQDIYGEILDSNIPAVENVGGQDDASRESNVQNTVNLGKYGEKIMDNEYFTIELLEKSCTGKELTFTYILTDKTQKGVAVNAFVDTEFDACSYVNGFGEELTASRLPEDSHYKLADNQKLCTFTQLGKEEYGSGMYKLFAEYFLPGDGEFQEGTEHTYFEAPIEIIGNDDYGLALKGSMDKTEGIVHFNAYNVYVSPLNVYLSMEGTYNGSVDSGWGTKSSHDITVYFADGTHTAVKVQLSSMSWDDRTGEIGVDMHAPFDTAIDPDHIVKVTLDDSVILEK